MYFFFCLISSTQYHFVTTAFINSLFLAIAKYYFTATYSFYLSLDIRGLSVFGYYK